MKAKILSIAIASLAGATLAGTYTWTGAANNGLYFTAGNWDYDDGSGNITHVAPPNETSDDIVIANGGSISYVPGGDWIPNGTVTISGNTTFTQTSGAAWFLINGTLILKDGATFDTGTSQKFRIAGTLEVRSGGHFVPRTSIANEGGNGQLVLSGGTIACPGEFQVNAIDFVNNGTAISCTLFSPQGQSQVISTFNSGNLTCTSSNYTGFFRDGAADVLAKEYINIPEGSTSRFTMPVAAASVYSTYFAGETPRFRYAGNAITEAQFQELFTVEDIDGTSSMFRLTPTGDSAELGTPTASSFVENATVKATIQVPVAKVGTPASRVVLVYGLVDGGMDSPDAWENAVDLGEATAGETLSTTLSGLLDLTVYTYAFVATNGVESIWTAASKFATLSSDPNDVVWTGAVSSDSRVAGNWFPEGVPGASSQVHVLFAFSKREMEWWPSSGGDVVASWTQDDIDSHYVMFHTTSENALTVAGDVSIAAGSWTHAETADSNGTPDTLLNVVVGGNMTIGASAFVTAGRPNGDNFAPPWTPMGFHRGYGPGFQRAAGASFAGDGGHTNAYNGVSYGSILNPLSYGSGGWGDGARYAGGGIVKLTVTGSLTVNGTLCSRGSGYPLANDNIGGAGSGGSVNVICGSLAGSGRIDANGGTRGLCGSGSGGRVRIRLSGSGATFADFAGTIEAVGGNVNGVDQMAAYDIAPAAAGTIVLEPASGNPTVLVSNELRTGNGSVVNTVVEWRDPVGEGNNPSATHLPSMQDGDTLSALKNTNWELANHGAIRLTSDVSIAALSLASDDGTQKVYTDGHTLTTKVLIVNGTRLPCGTYNAEGVSWIVGETGSVVVNNGGLSILIR